MINHEQIEKIENGENPFVLGVRKMTFEEAVANQQQYYEIESEEEARNSFIADLDEGNNFEWRRWRDNIVVTAEQGASDLPYMITGMPLGFFDGWVGTIPGEKYYVYVDGPNGDVFSPDTERNEFLNQCTEYQFNTLQEAELFYNQQKCYFRGLEEKIQADKNESEGRLKDAYYGRI